jgi:hypothetical protein
LAHLRQIARQVVDLGNVREDCLGLDCAEPVIKQALYDMRQYPELGELGREWPAQVVQRPTRNTTAFLKRLLILAPSGIGRRWEATYVTAVRREVQVTLYNIGATYKYLFDQVTMGDRVLDAVLGDLSGQGDKSLSLVAPGSAKRAISDRRWPVRIVSATMWEKASVPSSAAWSTVESSASLKTRFLDLRFVGAMPSQGLWAM